ncbi:Dbl homology domain-containing protein [Thozetella sp. PMI_491]|nr:Dbl homology domain-containing protein [Thozetella sp. PMI_491]
MVKQILQAEAIFVKNMSIVNEIFYATSEQCLPLSSDSTRAVFRNIDELTKFHFSLLEQLQSAALGYHVPNPRSNRPKDAVQQGGSESVSVLSNPEDRQTSVGRVFERNLKLMEAVHMTFHRRSEIATNHLIKLKNNSTFRVWLTECEAVATDLGDENKLDVLLAWPYRHISSYRELLADLLRCTPTDHPDREALVSAHTELGVMIVNIGKVTKSHKLQKEGEVRSALARVFGKRVDRPPPQLEDEKYAQMHEKFGDDYLRLRVALRDVEFYTRSVAVYAHEFGAFSSVIELVARLNPRHIEQEQKWAAFNTEVGKIETTELEQHLAQIRESVINPIEALTRCYASSSLVMKKRQKRRPDYEKASHLRAAGKKVDTTIAKSAEQYEALDEALRRELPQLSEKTAIISSLCLGRFVAIQTQWFSTWRGALEKHVSEPRIPEIPDIIAAFKSQLEGIEDRANNLGIVNPQVPGSIGL